MNELTDMFPSDKFAILACPSNQFGKQTNEADFELLNTLKYVRPGGGYEPKFPLSTKIDVNGATAHPLFAWMRAEQPFPFDDCGGQGSAFIMQDLTRLGWSPVTRTDIIWNFEKFLINQEGKCVRRYSPKLPTIDVKNDINTLITHGPNALN
uniref:Glutathione peroxidase n=1 Tax=Pycnococcus provasolii TaxID=41880 RepID=A0A7S2BA36_9CHLO|mmetsp:Transcript_7233/g.16522  ORF Transcript_7233/g.16522 Transcript_7233/m.16522 type:complete len:152 (+) Transcript_7233:308-763(+)